MTGARERDILFVTTSMGTRWESYSRALVRAAFPDAKHRIVDGRVDWHPLMFVETIPWSDYEVVVIVDEDCFIEADGLHFAIDALLADEGKVLAGVPDGGFFYREQNPHACNLFFLIVKSRIFGSALSRHPDWRSYHFNPTWASDPVPPWIDPARVSMADFEPYYGLFWAMRREGLGVLHLRPENDPENLATNVYLENRRLATHMWYLRNWADSRAMPGHSMPNRARYASQGRKLRRRFGWRDWIAYLSLEARRYRRRGFERLFARRLPLQ